jgi:hypothetical protein
MTGALGYLRLKRRDQLPGSDQLSPDQLAGGT